METTNLRGEITIKDLHRQIEMGNLPPVILFHGEETFLIEETLSKIRDKFLTKGAIPFNFEIHYAPQAIPSNIINSSKQIPVMAKRRVIVVKNANQWSSHILETFLPYLIKPEPKTCLIFIFRKIDKGSEFFSAIKSSGIIVGADRLNERELKIWINDYIKKGGKKIHPKALYLLIEYCNPDMILLSKEIDKLILFCHHKEMIGPEDVQEIISDTKMRTIFNFVDRLERKEIDKILYILNRLLEEGVDPLRILGMIARQFRFIWMIKEIVSQGGGYEDIMKRTGLKDFQVKTFINQHKAFSESEIERAFDLILETDRALKMSRLPKDILLHRIVFKLLASSKRSSLESINLSGKP